MSWKELVKAVNKSYASMPAKLRKAKIRKVIKTNDEKLVLKKHFPKLHKETNITTHQVAKLRRELEEARRKVEVLYATIHGMQDGALVRDQMALIDRQRQTIAELETYKAHHKTCLDLAEEANRDITLERRINSSLREQADRLQAEVERLKEGIEAHADSALQGPASRARSRKEEAMIETHVVSRELAERLKQNGFPQETVFYWLQTPPESGLWIVTTSRACSKQLAAPLLSEVLEQLPKGKSGISVFSQTYEAWFMPDLAPTHYKHDPNPANAAALLWLWWKEQE